MNIPYKLNLYYIQIEENHDENNLRLSVKTEGAIRALFLI